MKTCVRRVATLLVLSCPFLWSSGAAQESTASLSDLPTFDRAPEFLDAVRDEAGDDAAEALPSGDAPRVDLPDFLPVRLRHDLHRMEAGIRELRTVLFGQRGIFRLGEDEASGSSRFRLNLQYDPDPGLRFVLLTH